MYYRPESGEVFVTHSDIRSAMSNVIFEQVISNDDLAYHGVFPLAYAKPDAPAGKIAVPVTVDSIDGVWTQLWDVRTATDEELAAGVAALGAAKQAKNVEINAWRAGANLSTFEHAGKQIACDELSRSDIDGVANHIALFGAFPKGFPGGWKATDNSMIPLVDLDAFKAMYASMTAQGTANFNHAQELKTRLALAVTPHEVAAVEW